MQETAHTHCDHADWARQATESLVAAGYRRGGARQAVIDLLARQDCALSALEVEDELREGDHRQVGRASVYRVLDELDTLGLVQRVEVGQGVARYEPVHAGGALHHHHLVCEACGEVLPFADEELERAIARVAERVAFDVAGHDVVLRGRCAACRPAA